MISIKKSPTVVTQSTGVAVGLQEYAPFDNIENLTKTNAIAKCNIDAADGTAPYIPWLHCSGFGFDIPKTAKIEKVIVSYDCRATNISVSAPVVSVNLDGAGAPGQIPSSSFRTEKFTFETTDMKLSWTNPADITSSNFELEIWYPKNTGVAGSFEIRNICVEVQYTVADCSISVSNIPYDVIIEGRTISFTLSTKLNVGYCYSTGEIEIEAPSACEIITSDTITKKNGKYVWDVSFDTKLSTSETKISNCTVKMTEAGDFTFKVTESISGKSQTFTVHVDSVNTVIQITAPESMKVGETEEITVYNTVINSYYMSRKCSIEFPPDFQVEILSAPGSTAIVSDDFSRTLVWAIPYDTDNAEIHLAITPMAYGHMKIICYDEYESVATTHSLNVKPSNFTVPYFAKYVIGDETKDLMGDGVVYSALSFIKLESTKENLSDVYEVYEDFLENHRFGVYHGSGVSLTNDKELINQCQVSDFIPLGEEWFLAHITFYYHEDDSIVFYWTGEYLEKDTSLINVLFSTPVLIETPRYVLNYFKLEEYGNWPIPLKNLLTEGNYGSVSISRFNSADLFKAYDLDLEGIDEIKNFAFQGLIIYFDYETNEECTLSCTVYNNSLSGQRNTVLQKGEGTAKIGSTFDLFGLKYSDIHTQNLSFDFQVANPYDQDVKVKLKNLRVEVVWSILDNAEWSEFWINGESSRYYECFLKDLTILGGVDTDVEIFHAEGNDIHTAYRQSIDVKKIKLEFFIESCQFANATQLFLRAARWFMNKRDKYNRPIANTIEFEHIPDMQYKYILEEALDEEVLEGGDYKVKATLKVPSGTMEAKNSIMTANTGINNGIARVTPTIKVIALYNAFTITEENSGQVFKIENNNIEYDDIVTIDCTNRICSLYKTSTKETFDISASVNFDSDWFVLFPKEEYNFNCSFANFVSCEFYERW